MGQTSSQIDPLQQTQTQSAVEVAPSPPPSPAASVGYSGSRALTRDLEASVYASAKNPSRTRTASDSDATSSSQKAKTSKTSLVTARPRPPRKSRAAELRDEAQQQKSTKRKSEKKSPPSAEIAEEEEQEQTASRPRKRLKPLRNPVPEPARIAPAPAPAKIAYVQLPRISMKPHPLEVAETTTMIPSSLVEPREIPAAAKKEKASRKKAQQQQVNAAAAEADQAVHTNPEVAEPAKTRKRKSKTETSPQTAAAAAAGADGEEAGDRDAQSMATKTSRKRKRTFSRDEVKRQQQHQSADADQPEEVTAITLIDQVLLDERLAERTLTDEDLELEPLPVLGPEEPRPDGFDQADVNRIRAKNELRRHLKEWKAENMVYAGKAKWVIDDDGGKRLKPAKPGHRYKKHVLEEKEQRVVESKHQARQQQIAVTSDALLRILVKEELMEVLPLAKESNTRIPTPPDSGKEAVVQQSLPMQQKELGDARDLVERANRGVNDQVSDWLASQNEESPVPPEELESQSKKRKRKSTYEVNDEDDDDDDADDDNFQVDGSTIAPESANSASTATKAARQEARKIRKQSQASRAGPLGDSGDGNEEEPSKAQKRAKTKKEPSAGDAVSNLTRVSSAMVKGLFTDAEKDLADSIFDATLEQEGLTPAELVAQIKDWKNCGTFKKDLLEAFPNRTRDSVRKFAERRFHGMERGPWTEEQDQSLRAAHVTYPGQWTVIGDLVGRTSADCRDRWRVRFQHENAVTGPWSVNEENKLLAAVEECIDDLKSAHGIKDKALINNRDRLEALLSWTTVAQKLGGKRTGKRCHEKYDKLKARRAKDENASAGVGKSSTTRVNQHTQGSTSGTSQKDAEKMRYARFQVSKYFEIGDYYDAFVEIHSAFPDHSQKFHDEKNVLWSIVSSRNMNSRFSFFHAPSALRRAAFEKALEKWHENAPKMKEMLDTVDTIPAKALVLATWLERKYGEKLKKMKRTYKTELIGLSEEELKQAMKDRKDRTRKFRPKAQQSIRVSQDVISNSDEDVEDLAGAMEMVEEAQAPSDIEDGEDVVQDVPEMQQEPAVDDHEGDTAESAAGKGSPVVDAKFTINKDEEEEENDAAANENNDGTIVSPEDVGPRIYSAIFDSSDDENNEEDDDHAEDEAEDNDETDESEDADVKYQPKDPNLPYATTDHPLNRLLGPEYGLIYESDSGEDVQKEGGDSSSETSSDSGEDVKNEGGISSLDTSSEDSDSEEDVVPTVPESQMSRAGNATPLSSPLKKETPTLGSRQFVNRCLSGSGSK